jgi:hypothetical protein
MRVRISIVLAALAVTMVLPGVAAARGDSAAAAAQAEHDRILAYWTPARIAAAKWRDYTMDPKSGKITPNAKPGGGTAGAVTGASWTLGGKPAGSVGRILFSAGGSQWICSGTVVNAPNSTGYSVVLSAGHCAYDGTDGWSSNFVFYPDFDANPTYTCAGRAQGCWTASRLAINAGFYPSGFGPDTALAVDYSFAYLPNNTSSGELDVRYPGYGLKIGGVSLSDKQWAFGYPAEGRYKGKDLIYCAGSTIDDPNGVGTWGMACNMNGGSSGGGWLWGTNSPQDGSGSLSSVNSYGYSGLTYMFGPRFTAATSTVMGDVIDGSATNGTTVLH